MKTSSGFALVPVIILIAAIVVGGGYYIYQRNQTDLERSSPNGSAETDESNEATSPNPPGTSGSANAEAKDGTPVEDVIVGLSAQNNSEQDGVVLISDENGKAVVEIELGAADESVAQPSHVHIGSCAKIGAVKYSLSNVIEGESRTVLPISTAELLQLLPLAVNVHKSATEAGVYVSCGDITIEPGLE